MNKLTVLKNMGFVITWKLISIGVFGFDEITPLLTRDDVLNYLSDLLSHNGKETDRIISLLCEKENPERFDVLLRNMASDDHSNITIQKRKWRAFLLHELLDQPHCDYMQGLLALMEFWVTIATTEDCPIVFPKDNDKEAIQKFFSQQSYDLCLKNNRAWLDGEVAAIAKADDL